MPMPGMPTPGMPMAGMHAASMSGMTMALPLFVATMAAMMLPSAVPAIARRVHDGEGPLAAPLFAASYLGVWALAGLAMWLLYQPPGGAASGALLIGAGIYELTPLKRECRRRCRERVRSGARFGALCFGSSIGLMLVLVAVNVMSVPLMIAIGAVVLAQKLSAPSPTLDLSLALAIVALGVATAAA
jgi:predicted metal-binding membrane protein